jgi:hypothetical protein
VAVAEESDCNFLMLTFPITEITSIDREHLNRYKNLNEIKDAFTTFGNKVPCFGCVFVCMECPNMADILLRLRRRVLTYGTNPQVNLRALDMRQKSNPDYLLTTDLDSSAEELVQAYLDRWQIKVLHRDLKTGLCSAKLRPSADQQTKRSTEQRSRNTSCVPETPRSEALPELPAWRKRKPSMRLSQHYLITPLRNDPIRTRSSKASTTPIPKGFQ